MEDKEYKKVNSIQNGYSLIETLITIAMTGLVLAGIYGVFFSSNETYFTQDSVADTQQRARVAMDFMVRDIRMAGLDPMLTLTPGIEEATQTKIRFSSDTNMNGVIDNANRERITYEFSGITLYTYMGADLGSPPPAPPATTVLIDNVSDVTFAYRDADGLLLAMPVSAADLSNIRTVDISITCVGKDYKRKVISRTLQTRVSCRNLASR